MNLLLLFRKMRTLRMLMRWPGLRYALANAYRDQYGAFSAKYERRSGWRVDITDPLSDDMPEFAIELRREALWVAHLPKRAAQASEKASGRAHANYLKRVRRETVSMMTWLLKKYYPEGPAPALER